MKVLLWIALPEGRQQPSRTRHQGPPSSLQTHPCWRRKEEEHPLLVGRVQKGGVSNRGIRGGRARPSTATLGLSIVLSEQLSMCKLVVRSHHEDAHSEGQLVANLEAIQVDVMVRECALPTPSTSQER